MRKLAALAAAGVLAIGSLTGCGLFDPPRGVVIEKDADPETLTEDANWDITILTDGETEVEWDVTKRVFDGCNEDNPQTPEREPLSYFNGTKCE